MALFKKKDNKKDEKAEAVVPAKETKQAAVATGTHSLDWVLKKPRITEKSAVQMENNQYTFTVHRGANRAQIKQAVAAAYKVNPTKVNTVIQDGHMKSKRGRKVMQRGFKKAIVTLPANETIELV